MSRRRAVAIRHIGFEDLGSFAAVVQVGGYDLDYIDVGIGGVDRLAGLDPDLLVVLGGPIGAYEEDLYPTLAVELALLTDRLAADRPTLGICLGAQLIARALGAAVYPAPAKEIGWAEVQLTTLGLNGPLRHLDALPVLHWHGDTFDLPPECERLASTALCPNQAFARGTNLLGLQFHPEVQAARIELWLIGHACELAGADISPQSIRQDTMAYGAKLEQKATLFIQDWIEALR